MPDPQSDRCDEDKAEKLSAVLLYRVASLRLFLSFEKHRSTSFRRP